MTSELETVDYTERVDHIRRKLVEYILARGFEGVTINTSDLEGVLQLTLAGNPHRVEGEVQRLIFLEFYLNTNGDVSIYIRGNIGAVSNIFLANGKFFINPTVPLDMYIKSLFIKVKNLIKPLVGNTPSRIKRSSRELGEIDYFYNSNVLPSVDYLINAEGIITSDEEVIFETESYKTAVKEAINFAIATPRVNDIVETLDKTAIAVVPFPPYLDKPTLFSYVESSTN